MNSINLIGRITKDLELRYTSNNKAVCDFSIAVNRAYSGEEKEVDFINIQIWGKQAENLQKYQTKGGLIAISGTLRVDIYKDKVDKNKYKTYVLANSIEYISSKSSNGVQNVPANVKQEEKDVYAEMGKQVAMEEYPINEEDLPF